ncbi:MAG TPA: polyphosphate kinase 1 [Candidatus Limnocylindrales bacterium]|nr:polyphosphate kinase 1 [Candidatus Limnocylindrales bacterium]
MNRFRSPLRSTIILHIRNPARCNPNEPLMSNFPPTIKDQIRAIQDDPALPELTPETYLNRELSWIDFNERVLAQAQDERIPLLERIKFLAIVSSNTDEFFMVRVGAVRQKALIGLPSKRPDGLSPTDLLAAIHQRISALITQQRDLLGDLLHRLAQAGVLIADVRSLHTLHREALRSYFSDQIYPILTPLAVDHARPFPFISSLSLNLAIVLKRDGASDDDTEFVRVKIPDTLPRLISANDVLLAYEDEVLRQSLNEFGPAAELSRDTFVFIEDLIANNLDLLFPGMKVIAQSPFRLTRDADIDFEHEQEDKGSDISELIAESVKGRRFGTVVRLTIPHDAAAPIVDTLVQQLRLEAGGVYRINGALGAASLMQLTSVDRPDLKYPLYVPRHPIDPEENIFDAIARRDLLVHHPYDSFAPVESFFKTAARDPDVLAIKATLYRVGRNSPIVQSLMEARENDKQVSVLVELKARFDEENNLEWARAMEDAGVHVTYGVEELPVKTHAKVALVVRREGDALRRYVHLGTGNYNSGTARLYTDIGMFTANREIGNDASRLFNRLTGYAPGTNYRRLLVAPEYLLVGILRLIDQEIAAAKAGKPARLAFKMNQLEEDLVIRKLYQASQAGVQVDLVVRGLCCLRPGVPGLSENIRVRSIVGRYLEHSRIYYFQNAPVKERMYMGSADIMRRNLYNRVEVVFPVMDTRLQEQALRIFETSMADNTQGWALNAEGKFERLQPAEGEPAVNSQDVFMEDSFGLDLPR